MDPSRLRGVVQMFWDPEPSNDTNRNLPAWCLGQSYKLGPLPAIRASAGVSASPGEIDASTSPIPVTRPSAARSSALSRREYTGTSTSGSEAEPEAEPSSQPTASGLSPVAPVPMPNPGSGTASNARKLDTPPDSVTSSFDSSLAYEELPTSENGGWPQAFLEDVESRIWMTYRSDFELIPKSEDPEAARALSFSMRLKTQFSDQPGFSSDTGWGCMIRTGQCLLANTKCFLQLGRDWRRANGGEAPLLADFADDPRAPYSIHNFVRHGSRSCGKYPGEWFGPSATARCIQSLANAHESALRVYSTGDGHDVYADTFMKMAKGDDKIFRPTLILVSTRLGIDKITPVYWEALVATLQMSQSVGIAGGRPSSSLYFLGAQGQDLFYLDPHHTRTRLPYLHGDSDYSQADINSCHTRRLRRIHVRDLDPSMLIGFLVRSEEDWEDWKKGVRQVQGKAVINVADRDPFAMGGETPSGMEVETLSDDEDTMLDEE